MVGLWRMIKSEDIEGNFKEVPSHWLESLYEIESLQVGLPAILKYDDDLTKVLVTTTVSDYFYYDDYENLAIVTKNSMYSFEKAK